MRVPKDENDGALRHNIISDGNDPFGTDIELQSVVDDSHLMNDTVKSFLWKDITVTVKDHKTKQPKAILDGVDGVVEAGRSIFGC